MLDKRSIRDFFGTDFLEDNLEKKFLTYLSKVINGKSKLAKFYRREIELHNEQNKEGE